MCEKKLHRHGRYWRYGHAENHERVEVLRYWCGRCELTISVLPSELLPYRPMHVSRLEAAFDSRAEIGPGPDPAPRPLEEGCFKRAWKRLASRIPRLQEVLGQLLPARIESPAELWRALRRNLSSLEAILGTLATLGHSSLLGDYRCLRPP